MNTCCSTVIFISSIKPPSHGVSTFAHLTSEDLAYVPWRLLLAMEASNSCDSFHMSLKPYPYLTLQNTIFFPNWTTLTRWLVKHSSFSIMLDNILFFFVTRTTYGFSIFGLAGFLFTTHLSYVCVARTSPLAAILLGVVDIITPFIVS